MCGRGGGKGGLRAGGRADAQAPPVGTSGGTAGTLEECALPPVQMRPCHHMGRALADEWHLLASATDAHAALRCAMQAGCDHCAGRRLAHGRRQGHVSFFFFLFFLVF